MANELRNYLRGVGQDNSTNSHTSDTNEANLSFDTISANVLGTTGAFIVLAAGTLTGTAGTKTIRLKLGSTTVSTITQAAGTTSDWYFAAFCVNTATNAQRWFILRNTDDALTSAFDYATSSIDTTSNRNVLVTGQLGNSGDTVSCTMFDLMLIQIT